MVSGKGKEVAGGSSSGKRKFEDSDETGHRRKRKNRGVLQFFDDAAYEVDEDEGGIDSDFDDDFLEDEFKAQAQVINEPGKAHHLPFLPKEEELSGEELEEMLEERYRPGSSFVTYAEDVKMSRKLMDGIPVIPPSIEPTIWKVKCMVGRERHSAFCLMQKYVDLHSLGTKLQIISAFAIEHVKGFIYIEAERQFDINEACRGLCTIYSSRVAPVPKNEVSHLLSVRSKFNEISVGTWARIRNGKYKGDLAQVVAVNDARKKATVKLIPRIDIQAMAEKFGGGLSSKKTATPAPRLISSTELEEFRPLIQYRRDRDTGQAFEVLDGNQLKEGYLYKKVSIDSLSFSGVTPSEDELLKFEPSKKEESDCQEWLTQLYGERKKKHIVRNEKGGGGKGEGSSSSGMASSFEVHDLVLFGRKDFGVIVGTEKDDYFKILKEGSEGPAVMTVELHQLKNGSFDKKFTALDHQKKIISINDTVRVLEGPLQGRQGIVKQIYRGIVFLHDENEQENCGYSCCKSQICEKIKLFDGSCKGKGGELGSTGFEDFSSSPKSPVSPKKGWQARENSSSFNREGNDGMFSVGQSLRIRVGPLKGYLCRVLAIRRSDITVKLDSQQKILTVKCEHLAEVRGKSSAVSFGDDAESGKPFDLLGTQDCSTDWMAGAGTSAEGDTWGAGGLSAERSAWPAFPSSGVSMQPESSSANPLNSVDNDTNRDVGGSAWESKVTSNQNSSWGSAVSDEKAVSNSEQIGGWVKGESSWTKAAASTGFGSVASDNWGSAKFSSGDQSGPSKDAGDNWNASKRNSSNDAAPCWGNKTEAGGNVSVVESKNLTGGWGSAGGNSAQSEGEAASGWKKAKTAGGGKTESWGNMKKDVGAEEDSTSAPESQSGGWGNAAGSSWNKQDGGSSWNKQSGGSSSSAPESQTGGWGNAAGSSFNKQDGGSSWNKQGGGSSWGNQAGGSWNKQTGGSSTSAPESQTGGWGNAAGSSLNKQDGGSSWKKQGGGSSWGNQAGGSWNKQTGGSSTSATSAPESQTGGWDNAVGSSFNKQDWGSSWNKQGGGSSWGNQAGGSWNKQTGGSSTSAPESQTGEWGNAAGSSLNKQDGGSSGKKQGGGSSWGNPAGGSWNKQTGGSSTPAPENQTGGWGNASGSSLNKQDGGSSWGNQAGGSWDKQTGGSSTSAPESQTGGWGNASGSSLNKQDGESSWNKQGGGSSWGNHAGGSWNKQTGGSSASAPANQSGGWDNASGSSLNKQDGGSSWNKQGGGSSWGNQAGGSSWNKQTGGSSWMKQTDMNKEDDSKERSGQIDSWGKPSGGNSGFGGWSNNGMGNKDETDPKENWEGTKSFDGGRGSGGRRGRGGRGGRDQFGGGRSFGRGQSSGWSKEGQEYHDKAEKWSSSDGGGWGSSGGNKYQPEAESGGWKKSASVDGGQSGSWGNTQKDGGATGWGTKEGWNSSAGSKGAGNSSTAIPENQTGGWGNAGSSWGKSLDIRGESTGKGTEEDSWGKAAEKQSCKDGSVGSKAAWNTSMAAAENQSGGWGNAGGSWSKKSDGSSWGKQAGGSSWTKQTDKSSEESKEGTDQKGSWGKTSGGNGGFGGWNKSGMGNNDTDQAEGWGRAKSFEGGYDSAGSRGDSGYRGGYGGRGGSDRGSFRGRGWSSGWNEGQDSGKNVSSWSGGEGGGWGRGKGFDGGEDDKSDSGGFGGRGGSDRGGFRGRGRSDRGGYRGRGGFDRGGFRGRGSDRGGFGGRGGRRDQDSNWNSRNDSSEGKPSGWKKNDDAGGSWSQSGRGSGGSWSQSGGGGSWSGGGSAGGSWRQSGGGVGDGQSWNSGWNSSKGAVKSGTGDDQAGAGGWKGSGSAKDAGGSDAGGWRGSGSAKDAGESDAGGGWNSHASSWNKRNGLGTGGSSGTWNQSNVAAAADGGQSSGWNQPKEPRGANEDGGAADPWGKATASSWGKGKDGGSKGGW